MNSFAENTPWESLLPLRDSLHLKLIDTDIAPGLEASWAVNSIGEVGLFVKGTPSRPYEGPRSNFKNIALDISFDEKSLTCSFLIILLRRANISLFMHLCSDLVASLKNASTSDFIDILLVRLSEWKYLLSERGRRLSDNEQKGLIAELKFLTKFSFGALGVSRSVDSWTGCFKSPRDFSFGDIFVEVKSFQGPQHPFITVSSEFQLSRNEQESLFLYAIELNKATVGGESLGDVVELARSAASVEPLAAERLEVCLLAAGYSDEEDYSQTLWAEGETRIFAIADGFPRIDALCLAEAVSDVQYKLNLNQCSHYAYSVESLSDAIRGA